MRRLRYGSGAARLSVILILFLLLPALPGCLREAGTLPAASSAPAASAGDPAGEPEESAGSGYGAVDVDLTALSPTMRYAAVSRMNCAPAEYDGKTVRTTGTFAAIPARDGVQLVCRAADAAGCCFEPLEFFPRDGEAWEDPSGWPAEGETITVTGRFEAYAINEYMTYARLRGAEVVVGGE